MAEPKRSRIRFGLDDPNWKDSIGFAKAFGIPHLIADLMYFDVGYNTEKMRELATHYRGRYHKYLTRPLPASNPASIRAQVRRLASGQIQLKIPLKRGENALRKAHEVAKALGRKVVSVARATGKTHNPEENKNKYAVIGREGFFRDWTRVYSAHGTEAAAIKAAKTHRVNIPGNRPNQSSAMVIRGNDGFTKGEKIYGDTIRTLYPVVW
jgi:hypothetical protein